jgi:hypothetical protein
MLGREVVEGEQRVAIPDQAFNRLVVFDATDLDESVEGGKRILLGLGHPDFLQRPLGFRLLAVRQFVEDVGGFVAPSSAGRACGAIPLRPLARIRARHRRRRARGQSTAHAALDRGHRGHRVLDHVGSELAIDRRVKG